MTVFTQNRLPFAISCAKTSGQSSNSNIKITVENGYYKVSTPYSAQFVNLLKTRIPAIGRKWDAPSKCWLISANYKAQLIQVCENAFGAAPLMPEIIGGEAAVSFETTVTAEYVGNCNSSSGASSVYCNGGWNAKIPERVLRKFFKQSEQNAGTLYALLGCDESDNLEAIKKAYKRAARQWHPDICREENAREMFEQIKSAFDVLANPESRNKYNAGLFFERLTKTQRKSSYATFTPLLRCGQITAVGKRELGIFIVEEILAWDDITNESGQTMVSFWDGTAHSVMWV